MNPRVVRLTFLLVFAAVMTAASLWSNHGKAPLRPSGPFEALPPAEQQRRKDELRGLQAQVAGLRASAQRHEHRPFTLEVTDEELDTLLQNSLNSGRDTVRAMQCRILSGGLVAQGTVSVHGVDANVNMSGNVVAENGGVAFKMAALTVQGLPVPADWKDKAESAIGDRLNRELAGSGVKVAGVEAAPGKLTIQGVTD